MNSVFKTLAHARKDFAWVTDPYILMGKGEIKELMEGIGYSYDDAVKAEKLYMDVIIFDKPENVKKLIEPQIIDWNKRNSCRMV